MDTWTEEVYPLVALEPGPRFKRRWTASSRRRDAGFRCGCCRNPVHNLPQVSGVLNRNHCPYCLWSKHLDLHRPGDRLAACKALMRPVGVALKSTPKRYGLSPGELMLAHLCLECGKVSLNRIAADDDADRILAVYNLSWSQPGDLLEKVEWGNARLLAAEDAALVRVRLFGLPQ